LTLTLGLLKGYIGFPPTEENQIMKSYFCVLMMTGALLSCWSNGLAQNMSKESRLSVKPSSPRKVSSKRKKLRASTEQVSVPAGCGMRKPAEVGVIDGIALNPIQPEYPQAAKNAKVAGIVSVQVVIDEKGSVISATPTSGHSLLHGAAVQAAYQSRFPPTLISGIPIKITGILNYTFIPE
jgi:TonB family protein